MQQKVLIVTQIALFEAVGDKTIERGNCACAIVALPGDRPKYSLVCYNDSRETLCVGAISSSNNDGIQFEVQTSMYASFRDSTGKRWSCMFLNSSQIDSFLAALGIAMYALSGHPTHSTVITDFAPPTGEVRVTLQHLVKVRYSAFVIRKGDVLHLGELVETNGDQSYKFRPVQSPMALHPESKGFECGVLGMMEDSTRTIVVPATLPRGGRHLYGEDSVAFVVQIVRILHEDPLTREGPNVPIVFADGNNNSVALLHGAPASAGTIDSNGTKLVVLHIEGRDGEGEETSARRRAVEGGFVAGIDTEGAGVPAEQMALVQKLGAQVNNATTVARDVRDMVLSVAGEWKQAINRPKPSTLTNAALEQTVKQLIMDNECVRDDIARRDELIRALDHRNRELQKRVDASAMMSQQMMDEKNTYIRNASDTRLEKDRSLMKLQEQINQAVQERDDTERHLQTVKKLHGVSDEELRQIRTQADVNSIKAQSIASKLDTIQDAFAEERSRFKGLEARVVALQDEISSAEAELHIKVSQLEDVRRLADMERVHQAQIMEDERQRRGLEVQELRSEIIGELQAREAAFQADRIRVAEDHTKRGRVEGKNIGKREARIDVAARMDELRLDVQRALTELDSSKTQLRRVTEDGMAQNRILSKSVAELKTQMYEETRKRVRLESQILGARTNLRCARDKIMSAVTSIVHRLRRPAERGDLLQLLDALRTGEKLDFSFQFRLRAAEEADAMRRRLGWIEEEIFSLYCSRSESLYRLWVEPLLAEYKVMVQSVRHLLEVRDGPGLYEIYSAEARDRFEIRQQMEAFFMDVTAFLEAQTTERKEILNEAEQMYVRVLKEYTEMIEALDAFLMAELRARQQLNDDFMAARTALEEEEAAVFHHTVLEALMHLTTVRQDALMGQEESERARIEADQCGEFSGTLFDCEIGMMAMLQGATALRGRKEVEAVVVAVEGERNFARESVAPHSPWVHTATNQPVGASKEDVTWTAKDPRSGSGSSSKGEVAGVTFTPPPTGIFSPAPHLEVIMEAAHFKTSNDSSDDDGSTQPLVWPRQAPPGKRIPPPNSRLSDSDDNDW